MGVFFQFFYELMWAIIVNIAKFFYTIGSAFGGIGHDFAEYGSILGAYRKDFSPLAWVCAVLSMLLLAGVLVLLLYILFRLVRKYVVVRKKLVEQDVLLKEIAALNDNVVQLVDEKNKILAMKVSQLGLQPGESAEEDGSGKNAAEQEAAASGSEGPSRFVKLIAVDEKYTEQPFELQDPQDYTLPQLVDAFRDFSCSRMKLYYDRKVIMTYISAMATSRLIILEGISGTGKTSLPYSWGKFLKHESSICAVQPSWRDRSELVGYLNEFTKRFNETDFLKALYDCTYRGDVGFIVLDEMNLARIEYYFAEILSVLEMPDPSEWKIDIVPDTWPTDPAHIVGGKCRVPTNVWFVGTANNDDSTFTITDKVYDRATPIQLNAKGIAFECPDHAPMQVGSDYLAGLFEKAREEHPLSPELLKKIEQLDLHVIDNFRLSFGNRVLKQFKDFIPVYVACGGTELDGLDYMLTYKVLRKFEGLNIAFMQDNIKKLITTIDKTFGRGKMPEAKAYLERIMKMS